MLSKNPINHCNLEEKNAKFVTETKPLKPAGEL
jgi:hypothetical protein